MRANETVLAIIVLAIALLAPWSFFIIENSRPEIQLRSSMSAISEDRWEARWVIGLEYALWSDIDRYPELKRLSEDAGGWWHWPENEKSGPVFIGLDEWKELYEAQHASE